MNIYRLFPLFIPLIFFALFAIAVSMYAQENTIVYPIPELGNCENKNACRTYCDDSAHLAECITFAEEHDLMNAEEVARARKFANLLEERAGPGGCTSENTCEAYCQDMTHIDECLAFAEEVGHDDEIIREGRKISQHLKRGGKLPGGCTSKESCEVYCSDFSHMRECISFATEAGITIQDEAAGHDVSSENLEKIVGLMERGETPGGCTSREACEAYCHDPAHFEACVSFGERIGFISQKEAEEARKTGGRGPGGCMSEKECSQYCNTPENQKTCFDFGREHGILNEQHVREIEEGMRELHGVLENASPEVAECLKYNLGPNVIEDIETGSFTPGPELAERARGCIEKSFQLPEEGHEGGESGTPPQGIPSDVSNCVREKLQGTQISDPAQREALMRECFQEFQPPQGMPLPPSSNYTPPPYQISPEGVKQHEGTIQQPPQYILPEQQEGNYEQYQEQFRQQYEGQYQEQYGEQYYQYYPTEGAQTTEPPPPMPGETSIGEHTGQIPRENLLANIISAVKKFFFIPFRQ